MKNMVAGFLLIGIIRVSLLKERFMYISPEGRMAAYIEGYIVSFLAHLTQIVAMANEKKQH
jgi:hypothetical protein